MITLAADAENWIETGLTVNTAYTRYVEVYNSFDSNVSASSTVYTFANIPSSLSAGQETSSSITLSWTGDGIRYKVEQAPDAAGFPGAWAAIKSWADAITSAGYTNTSLQANTTYWYRVSAYNGDALANAPCDAVAWQTGPGLPGTPTDAGQWSGTLLTFNWTAGEASGAQTYQIQIGNTPGGNTVLVLEISNVYTSTQVTGADGLSYYIRLRARNSNGRYGTWTSSSDGITIDITPPGATTITSPAHPFATGYYLISSPKFNLTNTGDTSGISCHYYEFNQLPNTIPTIASSVTFSATLELPAIADGTYYLHMLPRDGAGNLGATASHFQLNILTALSP